MATNKKHQHKPAPPKKSPKADQPKKQPPLGPLGKSLLENLKKTPPGTSDETAIMQTFHAVPPAQLKALIGKATPEEHAMLFSALPASQIKSVLATLSAGFLAPAQPPPVAPSPTGGPPASILQTTYQNVPFPPAQADPNNWTATFSGGNTIGLTSPPPWEWVSVYDTSFEKEGSLNNPMVGLTGWAVAGDPHISTADVWFVHPFDKDFQYYIVPDPQFEGLLGPTNTGTAGTKITDTEYNEATAVARAGIANRPGLGLPAPKGVIGVESDHQLLPDSFQSLITDGTRIATFGRWIVDCGHNDFHTEIHPPLLIAVAKPAPPPAGLRGASQMTSVNIMSRPYTVSQKFSEGNFVDHLLAEVGKVEASILGIPLSFRVEAHPNIFTTPYDGRPFIKLLVQPPVPKRGGIVVTQAQQLMVSFHFTHRAGVAVQVFNAGNDQVGIIIVLGDLNPAKLTTRQDLTIQWSQLGSDFPAIIDLIEVTDLLAADTLAALILNRGILTDIYAAPSASSPLDNQNVAGPKQIDQVKATDGVSEDDTQPFPIYGFIDVWWQDPQIVIKGDASPEVGG